MTATGQQATPAPTDRQADRDDVQLAHDVPGLLGEFNRAGVLGVADVHAARAIGRIGGEDRPQVQLAVALAVRALRSGSVCIDLRTIADAVFADTAADDATQQLDVSALTWPDPEPWLADCQQSPLIAADGDADGRPLRMAAGLLYLDRYWRQEETVRRQLRQRAAAPPPEVDLDRLRTGLSRIFDSAGLAVGEPDLQQRAAAISVLRWVSVLAGGPGTGKTTTVAKLLALLQDQHLAAAQPSAAESSADGATPVANARADDGTAPAEGAEAESAPAEFAPAESAPAASARAESAPGESAPGKGGSRYRPLRIALAAPTGKAAARLEEAVRDATRRLPAEDRGRIGDLTASTLHRLLGWVPESKSRFRHHALNRLPYDVVVVDEMSMVSLTLMARLLDAVRPDARLVLVGDPDQLSSVEAGAVLADIVGAAGGAVPDLQQTLDRVLDQSRSPATAPADGDHEQDPSAAEADQARAVVRLQHTWRFGGAIDQLARAIRASDPDRVMEVLRSGDQSLIFAEPVGDPAVAGDAAFAPAALDLLRTEVVDSARAIKIAAESGDVSGALAGLERHRLLCAHRRGPYGVTHWTREILRWLADSIGGYATAGEWYPG
ncbi:MAG TPA: AAA family ATPase, partial [Microlunatus sp.]